MLGNLSLIHKVILFFKLIEPLFWLAQVLLMLSLLFPKKIFKMKVDCLNSLLKYQGFDLPLQVPEKVFKTWQRDLWVLFFLNPWIIVLIHLI